MEEKLIELLSGQNLMKELLETNQYTERFGVSLTEEDTKLLAAERTEVLKKEGRVEFGQGIMPKLIYAFCDSPYIMQEDYCDTLIRLQEIFYLYKNESLDELSDDELISYMRNAFDLECQGSLDYLEDTCLEKFARSIRKGTYRFFGRDRDYEE